MRSGLALLLIVLMATGCAGPTRVDSITSGAGTGAPFSPARDEAKLWKRAAEEERKLREAARFHQDPQLESYLTGVAARLAPDGLDVPGIRLRLHVILDPSLNAFTYPTGGIYIHSGLLARVRNEAQLATVIGHEITHVEERHLLEHSRSSRRKGIGFTIAGIVGSIVLAGVAGKRAEEGEWFEAYVVNQVGNIMLQLGLALGFLAAVNGFGRDLEREADAGALRHMDGAGYALDEAPEVFSLFLEDHGDPRKIETFFFGSHPNNKERIRNLQEMLASVPAARRAGAARIRDTREFHRRTRSLVRDNARLNIEAGRLGTALSDIERVLDQTPADPEALFLLGEVRRLQGDAEEGSARRRLHEQALDAYGNAVDADPRFADPWFGIGLVRDALGDEEGALAAFRNYLDLAPGDAASRRNARDYILELEARR